MHHLRCSPRGGSRRGDRRAVPLASKSRRCGHVVAIYQPIKEASRRFASQFTRPAVFFSASLSRRVSPCHGRLDIAAFISNVSLRLLLDLPVFSAFPSDPISNLLHPPKVGREGGRCPRSSTRSVAIALFPPSSFVFSSLSLLSRVPPVILGQMSSTIVPCRTTKATALESRRRRREGIDRRVLRALEKLNLPGTLGSQLRFCGLWLPRFRYLVQTRCFQLKNEEETLRVSVRPCAFQKRDESLLFVVFLNYCRPGGI